MKESHDDWSTLEAEVLKHARAGLSPGADRRGVLLEKLRIGLHPESNISGTSSAPSPPIAAPPASLVSGQVFSLTHMLLSVVAAAMVGFGGGYLYRSGPHAHDESSVQGRADPVPSAAVEQNTAAPHLIAAKRNEAAAAVAAQKEPKSQSVQTRSNAEHPKDRGPVAEKKETTTFYNELSYVRRAQSALQKGDGALALGLMESLDQIQHQGAMLAERNVTKVLALCLLDRTDEASQLARRALQSPATEMYRRRLATSCVASAITTSPAPQEDEQK